MHTRSKLVSHASGALQRRLNMSSSILRTFRTSLIGEDAVKIKKLYDVMVFWRGDDEDTDPVL